MLTKLKSNGTISLIEVDTAGVSVYYRIEGFENGLTEQYYRYDLALNRYQELTLNTK